MMIACSRREEQERTPARGFSSSAPTVVVPPPQLLHLPDADDLLPPTIGDGLLPGAPRLLTGRCPPEMVDVGGQFCIDRFEVTLVDSASGRELSPYFHPTRTQVLASLSRYRRLPGSSSAPPLPEPPAFTLEEDFSARARSLPSVVPQGYLSGDAADRACRAAGKRLCSRPEWVLACRGQQQTKFPYGEQFDEGACNVFREAHPAAVLHGDASREHRDPRLNRVHGPSGALLRLTGASGQCRSTWGVDGAFDMVGNLDEWVSDGSFLGGFYARATREGCEARIASHAFEYFDYSLGARCCL